MKTMSIKTIAIIATVFIVTNIYAQQQAEIQVEKTCVKEEMGCKKQIPGLSDEQKAKMKEIRLAHMKEVMQIKNQIAENRARFRSLMTVDKPDMAAIDKNIDEYSALQNKLLKAKAKKTQMIRNLLTEEQRIIFDQNKGKHKFREGRKHKSEQEGRHRRMQREPIQENPGNI